MLFTALQFSQALTYLDTAQQEVKASLGTHSDMLKQVSHIIMIYMIYIYIWACDKRSWSKVGHTASKSNSQ